MEEMNMLEISITVFAAIQILFVFALAKSAGYADERIHDIQNAFLRKQEDTLDESAE